MKDNFVIYFNIRLYICCNVCIEIECLLLLKFYENGVNLVCLIEKYYFLYF